MSNTFKFVIYILIIIYNKYRTEYIMLIGRHYKNVGLFIEIIKFIFSFHKSINLSFIYSCVIIFFFHLMVVEFISLKLYSDLFTLNSIYHCFQISNNNNTRRWTNFHLLYPTQRMKWTG